MSQLHELELNAIVTSVQIVEIDAEHGYLNVGAAFDIAAEAYYSSAMSNQICSQGHPIKVNHSCKIFSVAKEAMKVKHIRVFTHTSQVCFGKGKRYFLAAWYENLMWLKLFCEESHSYHCSFSASPHVNLIYLCMSRHEVHSMNTHTLQYAG